MNYCSSRRRFLRATFGVASALVALARIVALGVAAAGPASAAEAERSELLSVLLRSRERPEADGEFSVAVKPAQWDPKKTAVIICDMWASHHCLDSKLRVAEMAPFMNEVLKAARTKGVLIIHAPSGCMGFYKDTPQRRRAQEAPLAKAPVNFRWNRRDPKREPPLPVTPGCDGDNTGTISAWQIKSIEIGPADAISDNGQEVYNLLVQHGIEQVVIMGVHTNVCVLGRPFGIRQMVYNGVDIALCRDLTDTYHRDPGRHFQGLDRVVEHVEKYWCPTITSTDITGKPAFRFKGNSDGPPSREEPARTPNPAK